MSSRLVFIATPSTWLRIMNSSTAAGIHSPRLSGLLQHVDVVQAAEQISRLAIDLGCAFDCVRFVLGELSTVTMSKLCTMLPPLS